MESDSDNPGDTDSSGEHGHDQLGQQPNNNHEEQFFDVTVTNGVRDNCTTYMVNGKGFIKDREISTTKFYVRCQFYRNFKCRVRGVLDTTNNTMKVTR